MLDRQGVHAPAKAEYGYEIRQPHKVVDHLGPDGLPENPDQLQN